MVRNSAALASRHTCCSNAAVASTACCSRASPFGVNAEIRMRTLCVAGLRTSQPSRVARSSIACMVCGVTWQSRAIFAELASLSYRTANSIRSCATVMPCGRMVSSSQSRKPNVNARILSRSSLAATAFRLPRATGSDRFHSSNFCCDSRRLELICISALIHCISTLTLPSQPNACTCSTA